MILEGSIYTNIASAVFFYAPKEVRPLATNFIRFTETVKVKQEKRVVGVTIRPLIADCTGAIYFTDIQLQEGAKLTGFALRTETMLKNSPNPPRYQSGVVRGGETVVVFNTGGTSAALDIYIYPKQQIAAESVQVSQGMGSHICRFLSPMNAGDTLALKASTRECLKNGSPTQKDGFYQYTAAYDSKTRSYPPYIVYHLDNRMSVRSLSVLCPYFVRILSGLSRD